MPRTAEGTVDLAGSRMTSHCDQVRWLTAIWLKWSRVVICMQYK